MKYSENKNIKISKSENDSSGNFYTFDELLYTDMGQALLKEAHDCKKKITCICNGEDKPIPLTNCIMPSKRGYYLRRNKGTMEQHNKNCSLYGMNSNDIVGSMERKSTGRNANVSFDTNGIASIIIKSNRFIDNAANNENIGRMNNSYGKHRNTSKSYSTIYGIGDILLNQAWNQYVTDFGNNRNPKVGNLFYLIYNQKMKFQVKTDLGTNPLKEVMLIPFSKERNSDITEYAYKSVYQIYNKAGNETVKGINTYILANVGSDLYDVEEIGDYVKVKIQDPFLKNHFYIYINNSYYISIRNRTKKVIGADYFISAFVKPEDERMVVTEMAFIPVYPDHGFTVDSSKEIDFAKNRLLARGDFKDILFLKPPRYTIVYKLFPEKNYIPDFLLLEKETRKIATIVEIFCYYTKEYQEEQKEKIAYYSSLPEYNFIAWEVNKGKNMPYVPRIQKLKNV